MNRTVSFADKWILAKDDSDSWSYWHGPLLSNIMNKIARLLVFEDCFPVAFSGTWFIRVISSNNFVNEDRPALPCSAQMIYSSYVSLVEYLKVA